MKKHIIPVIVASFMLAIATAMLEDGPFTLPFLVGYLLGIVVPVLVFTGTLTLVLAGIYRVYTKKELPNLFSAMWGIWVLVAAVNFIGNYHAIKERQAAEARASAGGLTSDLALDWEQEKKLREWQFSEDTSAKHPEILALQTRFAREAQQLDAELARKVSEVSIPPLFDPQFLLDKSRFPAAADQLEAYGQLFEEYKEIRREMLRQMRDEIERLDLPQNEILQAIQEFDNTYEIDGTLTDNYFDVVIEVSRQGIAYLDFLNRSRYEVTDGRVLFDTVTETDKYKAFLQTFGDLSEQEVAAQRELAESREKRMARLRELSR